MAPSDTGVLRWLALADLPGIGPVGAWRLLARAEGRIESLFEHADAVLASWGLNEAQRAALHRPPQMGALAHDWMQRPDHHLLTPDHPLYPPLLREIPAAPSGLTHQCLYFEQPHTFEQILFIQTAEPALVGHAQIT